MWSETCVRHCLTADTKPKPETIKHIFKNGSRVVDLPSKTTIYRIWMYVYIYTVYSNIYIYVYIFLHAYKYTVCVYIIIYIYTYVCVYVHLSLSLSLSIAFSICIYFFWCMRIYAYRCVCMCIVNTWQLIQRFAILHTDFPATCDRVWRAQPAIIAATKKCTDRSGARQHVCAAAAQKAQKASRWFSYVFMFQCLETQPFGSWIQHGLPFCYLGLWWANQFQNSFRGKMQKIPIFDGTHYGLL